MAKIFVCDNPLDPMEHKSFEYNGPYIDWLTKKYPDGFSGPHATALNLQKLNVEDYDTILKKDDVIILAIYPLGPPAFLVAWVGLAAATTITTAVIGTVISFALNYIANSIFGGGQVKSGINAQTQMASPSPVYSLSIPTNRARLGQPIPVIYGKVIAVPDLATSPYTWFENNDMYLGLLFCLGQGWHSVGEIRVAATPVDQLAPGTVTYRAFAPDQHNQFFGTIQGAMGWYENMYTSPEVADQELDQETGDNPGFGPCAWKINQNVPLPGCQVVRWVSVVDRESGYPVPISVCGTMPPAPPPVPECAAVGQYVTVTNTNNNNGRKLITAITRTTSTAHVTVDPCFVDDTLGRVINIDRALVADPFDDSSKDLSIKFTYEIPGLFTQDDVGKNIIVDGTEETEFGFEPHFTYTGRIKSIGVAYDPEILWRYEYVIIEWGEIAGIGEFWAKNLTLQVYSDANQPTITFDCGDEPSPNPPKCGEFGIGPFSAPGPDWVTDHLFLDIIFPNGLYAASSTGEFASATVTLEFTATPIDDLGNSVGDPIVRNDSFTRNTNTPQRFTIDWPIAVGRYSVCARRTSEKSGKTTDMSNVLWTGLKAVLDSKGHAVYGKTTIIAVKAKATNGLSQDALSRFSVSCTRKVPDFTTEAENLITTSSNAHAFADIYRNAWYGANRPKVEIDTDAIGTLYQRTNCLSYFNAIFDTRITVWEALSLSVAQVYAFPATNGATLSVVEDIPREVATHCFNESNIVKDSMTLSYKFNDANTPDGVEVEYRNSTDFAAEYSLFPSTSLMPESITLFGCTSESQAGEYAQRTWNQRSLRREFIKFTTELEGHLPLIGNLISVDYPLLQEPTCFIVGSITPEDEFKVTIEGHKYIPAVYNSKPASIYVNINARSTGVVTLTDPATGYANGITITGYNPNQTLRLSLPSGKTFTAWSPYGKPDYDPALPDGSGSKNHFYVLKGPSATSYDFFGTNGGLGISGAHYNGYEAARAAFAPVTVTGSSQYTFVLLDGLFTDNSGGLSILVEVL